MGVLMLRRFSIQRGLRLSWLVIAGAACALTTSITWAASFACEKASTGAEEAICGSAVLSDLDDHLAVAYKSALSAVAADPDGKAALVSSQRKWIKERNACTEAQCIEASIKQRIEALALYPGTVTIHLVSFKDASPEAIKAVEGEFPGGNVHTLQMLDDQVAVASVETFPDKWSGFYLINLKIHAKSWSAIAPIGDVLGTVRDLGGNAWAIIQGESHVPGYFEHNYSAIRIRRVGDHKYESARLLLTDYAGEYESEENLCSYLIPGTSVNIAADLLTALDKSSGPITLKFRLTAMQCPSLSKSKRVARFVPANVGFVDSANPPGIVARPATAIFPSAD